MPTRSDTAPNGQERRPLAGALILGGAVVAVDELMDMAHTSVNVLGSCLATAVIARWEGLMPAGGPGPGQELERG
jgi:Na+/H+-dicarboxylate symporter